MHTLLGIVLHDINRLSGCQLREYTRHFSITPIQYYVLRAIYVVQTIGVHIYKYQGVYFWM